MDARVFKVVVKLKMGVAGCGQWGGIAGGVAAGPWSWQEEMEKGGGRVYLACIYLPTYYVYVYVGRTAAVGYFLLYLVLFHGSLQPHMRLHPHPVPQQARRCFTLAPLHVSHERDPPGPLLLDLPLWSGPRLLFPCPYIST